MRKLAALVVTAALCCSCASSKGSGSAASTLRSAANATAQAHSFTLMVAGAEVTYEAPNDVQQVEHGQGSSASGNAGGSESSSSPHPVTLTKVFIDDRYYEASTADGQEPSYSVSERCSGEENAADYVLRILRTIGASAEVQETSGDRYVFRIPEQAGPPSPTSGIATISGGFVRSLNFALQGASMSAWTIDEINSTPPVTAPFSSSEANVSCGQ